MADDRAKIILDGDITPLRQKLREAGDDLKRFGASGGSAIDGLASSVGKLSQRFTALGALMTVGTFVTLVRQSIDAADAVNDLALRTQTSVKALASFKLIAEQSGTELPALGKGLNKLSIFMAENEAAAKKLGITARDPVQAFIQFADALARAATPQDRAAIANRVLGKSYESLLPLLGEGTDKLRAAAAASEDYAQKLEKLSPRADAFNDRLAEMKLRWDSLKISMGSAFLDLLPNSMTMDAASARIISLNASIGVLQRALENSPGSGLLHRMLYGTKDEITAKLAAARKELADLMAQKSAPPNSTGGPLTIDDLGNTGEKAKAQPQKVGHQVSDVEWEMEEAAHLQRTLSEIDKERNEYHDAANKAVLDADKKLIKEMDQIHLLRIADTRAVELARLDEMEASARQEMDIGRITQAEYLSRLDGFNQARLLAEGLHLDQKREIALQDPEQNPVELERIELERAEIRRRYAAQGMGIQRQQALESRSIWRSLTDSITGLWDKGVQALMNGTLTWRNAFKAIGAEMARWFAVKVVGDMVKDWLAGQMKKIAAMLEFAVTEKGIQAAGSAATVAIKGAETTAVVGANAAQAGTGAAASQAGIPIVGPVLAIAAMAAIFGAVMAMGSKKSASRGYDIPRGLNPLTQLHEEEMVLPAAHANTIRRLGEAGAEGGGRSANGGAVHMHVHTQSTQDFARFLKNNSHTLAPGLRALARNFTPVKK